MYRNFTYILFALFILLVFPAQASSYAKSNNVNSESFEKQKQTSSMDEDSAKFTVVDSALVVKNVEVGTTIDVYSVLGAKVHSFVYKGTPEVLNLKPGIYIVRSGKTSQKIIL